MLKLFVTFFAFLSGLYASTPASNAIEFDHGCCQTATNQNIKVYPDFFRFHFLKERLAKLSSLDIAGVCDSNSSLGHPETKFVKLLNEARHHFSNPKARLDEPDKYVEAMDRIILASEYGFLLKCRDQWKSLPGKSFKTTYFDSSKSPNKLMSLSGQSNLELNIDLYSSFQRVLFAYMHEMLHVCQSPLSEKLQQSISAVGPADYNRFRFLMEIEAHSLMVIAFSDFARYSPNLCREDNSKTTNANNSLGSIYSAAIVELLRGTFPQHVITWYRQIFYLMQDSIYAENTKEVSYQSSLGPAFSIKCLHPKIVKNLIASGFQLQQGSLCSKPINE